MFNTRIKPLKHDKETEDYDNDSSQAGEKPGGKCNVYMKTVAYCNKRIADLNKLIKSNNNVLDEIERLMYQDHVPEISPDDLKLYIQVVSYILLRIRLSNTRPTDFIYNDFDHDVFLDFVRDRHINDLESNLDNIKTFLLSYTNNNI